MQLAAAQGGTTLDPKNAKDVAKDIADAVAALAKGDAARDGGKPATAIDRYRQAWDAATDALQQEAKQPELKKDEKGKSNEKDDKGGDKK